MRKIDRLGWAAGFSCLSYGVRVGVRATDPDVLDRVVDLLPPGWKPARPGMVERLYSLRIGGAAARPGVRRFNLVYADAYRLSRTQELDDALKALKSDVQLYVAEAARRRLFVHAGVVRWRGKAIIVPGRSRSGKSTLVRELVRAGATYYSDEYAVLDSQGRVHPYPRPLTIRGEGVRAKPVAGDEMGRPGVKPIPVGLVVVTRYRAGASWRPRELSPGRSVIELVNQTVSARREPRTMLTTLRQVVLGATVLKGVRGEAEEMAATVLERATERSLRRVSRRTPAHAAVSVA